MNKTTGIFLLRGLARETRHWGGFLPKIAESFAGAAVHPLEIPGTGELRQKRSPLSVDGYIASMRQQFLHCQTPVGKKILIGFSFGGMITARWLERHPKDFNAAVLINTSSSISKVHRRMRLSGARHLVSSLFHQDSYTQEKKIASLICNIADPDQTARLWAKISRSAPVSKINLLRQLYAAITFHYRGTGGSVLILCSSKDRLVSPDCSYDLASLWQKEIICHEQAGHDLTTDDPDWCITQLQSWLSRAEL